MSTNNHFLNLFFNPQSIAIVGASRMPNARNYTLVSNLVKQKFQGKVYPVNPNATEIMGLKAYPDLKSIEGDLDLAVLSVPAGKTLDIVKDCVAKKVKGVTIIAGGFSETGVQGKGVQEEISRLLREARIRTIGPNALGPINTRNNFIISWARVDKLPQGGLSFIFQSGLYEPRLNWLLSGMHLNLNKLIDLGNKMDINEVDALEYLGQDPETKIIAIHFESVAGDAKRFLRLLKETTKKKPVIVLKSGRTVAGAKAASSHTGAIIKSSDTIFDTALKQAGVIRVLGLDEFFDFAKAFEYLPRLTSDRIAVASRSGGEGVIATDFCELSGLRLAEFSSETRDKIRSIFPPWEIPFNPLDTGVCGQFNEGVDVDSVYLNTLAGDPNVDCVAMPLDSRLAPADMSQSRFLTTAIEFIQRGKPMAIWSTDPVSSHEDIEEFESNRVPVYLSAERAIRSLGALYRYHKLAEQK
ncbi:MAG: CoA-binding protein [Chloroflexota bacterium]